MGGVEGLHNGREQKRLRNTTEQKGLRNDVEYGALETGANPREGPDVTYPRHTGHEGTFGESEARDTET